LIRRGAYPQAIKLLQQAVTAQPAHFESRLQLAKAYLDWVYMQARMPLVDIQPNVLSAEALHYLQLAESQLVALARLRPASPHVQELLAIVHLIYGRPAEAQGCLKKALAKNPANPELLYNMGYCLTELGRYAEAATQLTRLTALHPEHGMGWQMLGEASRLGDNPEIALAAYRRAIKLLPDWPQPFGGMASTLVKLGRHTEGLSYMEKAIELAPSETLFQSMLFDLHFQPELTAAEIAARHRAFGERFEAPLKPVWQPHANVPDPERTLRVGFVSPDFRRHSVGYFMADLLGSLKATGLELLAYSNGGEHDDLTERIKPQFTTWCECQAMNDGALAAQIRADRIDILIDLAGHTKGNRLLVFARKPAPVQVTYLGYFDTTGLTAMDYILGNRWLLPEAEEALYTEKPWRLPDAHLCFTPPDMPVEVGRLPAEQAGHVTFGCFNQTGKVNIRVVADWAKLLHAVPGSLLYLKHKPFGEQSVVEHYRRLFAGHGIGPERLIMEGESGFREYLESYNRVDIALDPYPYNGGTTTVQALWMGVPVLALQGDRYGAHMGESILHTMDMPEWISADEDDYVARAAAFASDLPALAALRAGLRDRLLASPICDAPRFAHNLENALRGMWREWCAGKRT
jgi:predicted O-linked N-acetylglucosamine transferase (SPINDLY family)